MPSTAAEQEAKRRSGWVASPGRRHVFEDGFTQGAEWALEPYRELLEAAREYKTARAELDRAGNADYYLRLRLQTRVDRATGYLWAAAAALNEEGGK